ncbi:MAG: hypothetical protein HYW27_04035 [Candidatus Aenigmarchaeota archaeon]|nr:hypothetical protein [Candidatus Aenigmarchaeota archaeon]
MNMETAGKWVFLASIVIAVIAGAVATAQSFGVVAVLAVLGLIVGLLNVTEKEATAFLVATIALALLSLSLGSLLETIGQLASIITNIGVVAGTAGLVVALKTIWSLSSSK